MCQVARSLELFRCLKLPRNSGVSPFRIEESRMCLARRVVVILFMLHSVLLILPLFQNDSFLCASLNKQMESYLGDWGKYFQVNAWSALSPSTLKSFHANVNTLFTIWKSIHMYMRLPSRIWCRSFKGCSHFVFISVHIYSTTMLSWKYVTRREANASRKLTNNFQLESSFWKCTNCTSRTERP